MDDYFLGFFAGASGTGSEFALGGLPLPGTLRIASKSSTVYSASCEKGLRPARKSRFFTVSRGILSFSAISETVKPVMTFIIGILLLFLYIVYVQRQLLYSRIVKALKKIKISLKKDIFALTKSLFMKTI